MENILFLDSKLYSKCKSYQDKFNLFADEIMHNVVLKINGLDHRIAEGEFYLYADDHLDKFTHKDEQQSNPYHFYFHRFHNGTYKNGTFKGMDVTFTTKMSIVNGINKVYGGFLIRAIVDPQGNYIDGPCKVVDLILKLNKEDTIKSLLETNKCTQLLTSGSTNLCLEYKKNAYAKEQVFKCIRVGLFNKDLLEWWVKDYRFLLYPLKTKKYKHMVIASLYSSGLEESEIAKQTQISEKTISTYISYYKQGKEHVGEVTDLFKDLTGVSEMIQTYAFISNI